MVPVSDYSALWAYIKTLESRITHLFLVDDESELSKKIEELSDLDVCMVFVFPSADQVAPDEDNISDVDTCIIYILQKVEPRNMNDSDLMTERILTQNVMNSIRSIMLDISTTHSMGVYHRILKNLIRGKQHIDRERNYMGCNGYSLSFGIRTLEFSNISY